LTPRRAGCYRIAAGGPPSAAIAGREALNAPVATPAPTGTKPAVAADVLGTIGNTPLVRLARLGRDLAAPLLAKVESFNPGGSVKDRIGLGIVEAAEAEGRLRPGGTIVEATSGNTGIGLAIVAALKGYKTVFVLPDKMSDEKIRLLRAYGARVVITPTAVEPDDPRSYYSVARQLAEETPGAILANQYHNQANPLAHYQSTGPELWNQTEGRLTHFVCGLGTGGTVSGAGRYLKERNPALQVVGVDPVGSVLHDVFYTGVMPPAHSYKTEGIGEDFIPGTLDFSVIDDIVQVTDAQSLLTTRRLVREEGLFVGGSSGSAVAGALTYMRDRQLGPEALVVVLLPDSGDRYLSKVFNDDWMREHGFGEGADALHGRVADLLASRGPRELICVDPAARMTEVVALMKGHDISQVPVVRPDGELLGIVSERDVLDHLLGAEHAHTPEETIEPIVSNRMAVVEPSTSLAVLGRIFADGDVAVVREDGRLSAVLTKIDLLDHLSGQLAG
jgi:cystathionine beta-synthase